MDAGHPCWSDLRLDGALTVDDVSAKGIIYIYIYIEDKIGKCHFRAKKGSIMPNFPNLLGKCSSFEIRFSQNRVKPYSDVFKEPIVTF